MGLHQLGGDAGRRFHFMCLRRATLRVARPIGAESVGAGSRRLRDGRLAIPPRCQPFLFAFAARRRARWLGHSIMHPRIFCGDIRMTFNPARGCVKRVGGLTVLSWVG